MPSSKKPDLKARRAAFEPFRAKIRVRPTNPTMVGRTGTAVADTLEEQIRFEVDLLPEERWARTILVLPEDLQRC